MQGSRVKSMAVAFSALSQQPDLPAPKEDNNEVQIPLLHCVKSATKHF